MYQKKSNYTNIINVKWRKYVIYEAIPITDARSPQKSVETDHNFIHVFVWGHEA